MTMHDGFEVWERRDAGSAWGPYSAWTRPMLDLIETGHHEFSGVIERDDVNAS